MESLAELTENVVKERKKITKRRLQRKKEVKILTGKELAAIREKLNFSQSIWAAALNTSCKSLQRWEQAKDKAVSGPVSQLALIYKKNPALIELDEVA